MVGGGTAVRFGVLVAVAAGRWISARRFGRRR
jgi:hypothetical protein